VLIEVATPEEVRQAPQRIPECHRLWRPDYQLPVTPSQPLDGLAPSVQQFQALTTRLGIHEESEVVLLDRQYDATRLWWLFRLFGKEKVRLLDGGYKSAAKEGLVTSLDAPSNVEKGTWEPLAPNRKLLATLQDIQSLSLVDNPSLWDVRTVEEYNGAVTLDGAKKGGRIPWASSRLDWSMFRGTIDGIWLEPEQIRKLAMDTMLLEDEDDKFGSNVHTFYCQSGVRTTQLIFGLSLAGWPLDQLKNYDGSWIERSHGYGPIAAGRQLDSRGKTSSKLL
jgi:thiosulfate/3-mercaptopyruvate sulfurtransferase